ncbi:hypothetical protein [Spirosoma fluminis]
MSIDRKNYPPNWEERSRRFRAEVAHDQCQRCGVTHGTVYPKGPDLKSEYPATRIVIVMINTAHRYRDVSRSDDEDLIALCPRCHAYYDLDDSLAKRSYGVNYAGDHQLKLFTGEE